MKANGLLVIGALSMVIPSVQTVAAPSTLTGLPFGQEKKLDLPGDLMQQIVDVLTLQGKATEAQFLIREQAFLTALDLKGNTFMQDPQTAVRAALSDPEVLEAGLGEAVIAGPSGGEPCGQGENTCARALCLGINMCRNTYPCSWMSPGGLGSCIMQRINCGMQAHFNHGGCLSSQFQCGGVFYGTEDLFGCPNDPRCRNSVTKSWPLEINAAGTGYSYELIFNATSALPLLRYRVRLSTLVQGVETVYFDSMVVYGGCVGTFDYPSPNPIPAIPSPGSGPNIGASEARIYVRVTVDLDCLGSYSKSADFNYRLICKP